MASLADEDVMHRIFVGARGLTAALAKEAAEERLLGTPDREMYVC